MSACEAVARRAVGRVKTYVATKNLGKLAEMRMLFARSALELDTYPLYAEAIEDATDYLGNARLKARALDSQLRGAGIAAAVLADDSGLEVDALGGRPGLLSARYGGVDIQWPQRRSLLLNEMAPVPWEDRGARFVCTLVLLCDGRETLAEGVLEGRIAQHEGGRFGFGYDPLFVPSGDRRTLAEFSDEEKNAISHRRLAADALLALYNEQRV